MQISSKQDPPQPKVGFSDTEAWIRVISLRCQEGQPIWIQVSMPNTKASIQPEDHAGCLGEIFGDNLLSAATAIVKDSP